MEAPAESTTAEVDQRKASSGITTDATRRTEEAVTIAAGSAGPKLNGDTVIRLDNIDLMLPPEIWGDFRAPHLLGVIARLSRIFYCATRLEPLWRLLMKRDFPVEHTCTYDHDVERAGWFGLYREQFQSRWKNLALKIDSFRDPKLGSGFRLTVTNLRSAPITFSPKGIRFTFAEASGISPVSYQMILKDFESQASLAPSQVLKESYVMQMKTGGSNDGFCWGLQLTNIRTKVSCFHPVYSAPRRQFRLKVCAEYFPGSHFTRISCMGRKLSNVLVYTEQGLSVPFKPLEPPEHRAYD